MRVNVLTGREDHVGAPAQNMELRCREVPLVPHGEPSAEGPQRLAVIAPQVAVAHHSAADTDVPGFTVRDGNEDACSLNAEVPAKTVMTLASCFSLASRTAACCA